MIRHVIRNIFTFFLICIHLAIQADATTFNNHNPVDIFTALPFPKPQSQDQFTLQLFAAIDETFGQPAFKLTPLDLQHIKNTYLYLIFLTKLDKIKSNPQYNVYKLDFAPFLTASSSSMPQLPTQQLLESDGWKNIAISAQDLINSTMWQLFCKSMICDSYIYFTKAISIIHNTEQQTFNYLANFETNFYNADFSKLRTINDIIRAKIILEHETQMRYLQQCSSWQKLPSKTELPSVQPQTKNLQTQKTPTQNSQPKSLSREDAVTDFLKTPFYIKTHDLHELLGTRSTVNSGQTITGQQLLSAPQLQSPLKEYVFGYFMLYEMYGKITSSINLKNAATILDLLKNSKLAPQIVVYQPQDLVLLCDILYSKSVAEGTHNNSVHPTAPTFNPEHLVKNPSSMLSANRTGAQAHLAKIAKKPSVQGQSFLSFFNTVGHDVSQGFNDVKNGVEQGCQAVASTAEGIGYGAAGLGCSLIFWNQNVVKEGQQLSAQSRTEFTNATNELEASITNFSKSLEDGLVAPFTEIIGDVVGFITQNKQLGQSIAQATASAANAIIQVVGQLTANAVDLVTVGGAEVIIDSAQITTDVGILVVRSAQALFSSSSNTGDELSDQLGNTLTDCYQDLATLYVQGKVLTTATVAASMQAMGNVMNSITTLFIDLSREITLLLSFTYNATVGGIVDAAQGTSYDPIQASQAAANHVSNVLNAHRQTINQVLGVAVSIGADVAFDTATGGAGAAADAEIDAMIMGSVDSTETAGADVVAESADTQVAAEGTEQTAVDAVEEKATQDAAQQAEQQAATKAAKAKEALESVAKGLKEKPATWGAKTRGFVQDKIESATQKIRSLPKNLANLIRSNKSIAQDAIEDVSTKQDAINAAEQALNDSREALLKASQEGDEAEINTAREDMISKAKDLQKAQADLKQAQEFQQAAAKIATESNPAKAFRYLKNALSAFKPLGEVINIVFNVAPVVSSYNQDSQNQLQQTAQLKQIQNMWSSNNENKLSQLQSNMANMQELQLKQQAAIGNQILGLALYQNYSNAAVDEVEQNIVQTLAPIYLAQLLPNAQTGLRPGNTGSLWNLTSNYLNLYPSQSFFTTTTGRSDFPFAQEIAQAPQLIPSPSKQNANKYWFNQRCTAVDSLNTNKSPKQPLDPLTVSIDLDFIYTLNSEFYVGLYLGGNYHDYFSPNYLASLLKTTPNNIRSAFNSWLTAVQGQQPTTGLIDPSVIDLNETYLAKMVILYRKSATDQLRLAVFEHLGPREWIADDILAPSAQLDQHHTYQLQATLNGTKLDYSLTIDNATTPLISKTVTVSALTNQRMYGIISSGAALQWNQILPAPAVQNNRSPQMPADLTPEQQRGRSKKLELITSMNPTFGQIPLTPVAQRFIIHGQYIYATTKTDLAKLDPKNPTDFVVFATNTNGTISNIGKAPNSKSDLATNVIISLITGHVLDAQGNCIKIIPNVWQTYKTSNYQPFSQKLDAHITQEQKTILTTLSKITFGPFACDIINNAALANNRYIYTCAQTLFDATGKALTDYLCFTQLPQNSSESLQLGLPPTLAQACVSLVSGKLYAKTTKVTTSAPAQPLFTYSPATLLTTLANQNGMDTATYQTISQAQINYAEQQQTTTPAPANNQMTPVGSIQSISTATFAPTPTGSIQTNASVTTPLAPCNIADRQRQAAGGTTFQFHMPIKSSQAPS